MFYPFVGALCFILTLIFFCGSGMIILMHKADEIKYTVRRGVWLSVMIMAGSVSSLITTYCIYGTITNG